MHSGLRLGVDRVKELSVLTEHNVGPGKRAGKVGYGGHDSAPGLAVWVVQKVCPTHRSFGVPPSFLLWRCFLHPW